jgi:hypothetical protein
VRADATALGHSALTAIVRAEILAFYCADRARSLDRSGHDYVSDGGRVQVFS